MVSKAAIKLMAAASLLALWANGGGSDASAQISDRASVSRTASATTAPNDPQVVQNGDTIVGSTDIVRRDARGILEQNIRELKLEDQVFFSEVVETGDDSALRVTLLDETTLTLGPDSRVVLDEFVYDPASNDGRLAMRLISGVFRFTSGLLPKPSYSIGTRAGNIGIRGTDLYIYSVCAGGQGGGGTTGATGETCQVIVDVEEGSGVFNPGPGETPFGEGQRVEATNTINEVVVGPIPNGGQSLPEVLAMRRIIIEEAFNLFEGALPGGSIANTSDDDIAAAITQLLEQNENLALPLVEAVNSRTPARAPVVVAAVVLFNPELAPTVASTLINSGSDRGVLGLSLVNPAIALSRDNRNSDESSRPNESNEPNEPDEPSEPNGPNEPDRPSEPDRPNDQNDQLQ